MKFVSVIAAAIIITSELTSITNARSTEASFVNASFYACCRLTASGEPFDPDGFTAASPTLPFGVRLELTNPKTGRSIIVRVNDRGPFVKGRDLDLTRGAAKALGMIQQGTARLQISRLD